MDNLQEMFDCMMSFTPAQVRLYEMQDKLCVKYYDEIDPNSGVFPDGYYEGMRAIADEFKLQFVDPRGLMWKQAARENRVTVH